MCKYYQILHSANCEVCRAHGLMDTMCNVAWLCDQVLIDKLLNLQYANQKIPEGTGVTPPIPDHLRMCSLKFTFQDNLMSVQVLLQHFDESECYNVVIMSRSEHFYRKNQAGLRHGSDSGKEVRALGSHQRHFQRCWVSGRRTSRDSGGEVQESGTPNSGLRLKAHSNPGTSRRVKLNLKLENVFWTLNVEPASQAVGQSKFQLRGNLEIVLGGCAHDRTHA